MNILFQIRDDYKINLAGDTIQMIKTKEYLEKLGVNIQISSSSQADLTNYDLVHLFNLIRVKETYQFAQNAIKQSKKYVLSTIYWNMADYISKDKYSPSTLEWWMKNNLLRSKVLAGASALLPNSSMEIDILKNDFNINNVCYVIPNCSDRMFYQAKGQKFAEKYGLKDFVLCVGPVKLQKKSAGTDQRHEGNGSQISFNRTEK